MPGFLEVRYLRDLSGFVLRRAFLACTFFILHFFWIAFLANAQTAGALHIDESDRISLSGNIHPRAMALNDIGRVKANQPMERIILVLNLRPGAQRELDQLIAEQHSPASPLYHHWLTPEEFGRRFGIDDQQLNAVTSWLTNHGFKIDEIAKGRNWINFSGNAAQVEQAFHTEMHQYLVNGEVHQANSSDPSIPRGLMSLVRGVASLHDFRSHSMHTQVTKPDLNLGGGGHAIGPTDFAIIYDLGPLFNQGVDGTGQSIAVVGRSNIVLSDVQTFRSFFALPANDPVITVNGADPGTANQGEEGEADLDVEWSGAVAPGATIQFVTSKSTNTSDGANLSAQYIINHNVAPVMTMSFGLCEASLGSGGNAFFNSLWQQAAAQGISAFVSSGDSGAAECDAQDASSGTSVAVSGISSSPYDIAVGGSEFNEGTGTYWKSPSDPTTHASALSYIPEVAWNESGSNGGSGLHSSGGGASMVYSKPTYQAAPGVPADGRRDVPDVSLTAAGHDGYVVCQADTNATCVKGASGTPIAIVSGTSASTPAFAGIMALVVQKTGQRQGVASTVLYPMANNQYANGGLAVFHDVTSGDNTVPGITGFNCGPGYDQVTGLGSVDATLLVNNWGQAALATAQLQVSAPASVTFGSAFNITVTAQDINGNTTPSYTGTVHLTSTDGLAILLPPTYTFVAADNGVHTFGVTLRTLGNQTVTATDTNTSSIMGTSAAIMVNPGPATHYLLTGTPASTAAGVAFNLAITAQDSFNNTATGYRGTVHFTSSDGQASLPNIYTFTASDNGVHTFSFILGTQGGQTVTATDSANSLNVTSPSITVNPGATAHFKVQPSTTTVTASTSSNLNVTVTAQDAYNNTTPAYGGTVHFTSGDPQAVLPANSMLASGAGTFPVTLKTAGPCTIIATDMATSSITGTSSLITVSSAAARSFSWSVPVTATVGTAFSVTLKAFDSFSNLATSYTGSVQFSTTGTPTVTVPGNYTFTSGGGSADNGSHTFASGFTVTAGTQGNTFTLTANDAGNAITATSSSITVTTDAFITPQARYIHIFRANIPVVVASFTDADAGETGSDYNASINWGDGSTPDSGCTISTTNCKIVRVGSSSVFKVMGAHVYKKKGSFTVHVTLTDAGGSQADAFSTARFFPVNSSH